MVSTPAILAALGLVVVAAGFVFAHHIRIQPSVSPGTEVGRRPAGVLAASAGTYDSVHTFSEVQNMGFLSEAEITAYLRSGPRAARVAVNENDTAKQSAAGTTKVVVLVVRAADTESAEQAARQLDHRQLKSGMRRIEFPGTVWAAHIESSNDAADVARAHYASGPLIVRVGVTRPDSAVTTLRSMLNRQLRVLPADA